MKGKRKRSRVRTSRVPKSRSTVCRATRRCMDMTCQRLREVSRYEQEKLQLQEKIQKLQEISIADKPWTLLGEAFSLSLFLS